MSQDQNFEAARARIQRLVEEIAALTKRDMRSEEYFQEYLTRVVQACDGKGGAVWLVVMGGSFDLRKIVAPSDGQTVRHRSAAETRKRYLTPAAPP